jgi:hypothetical protein
MIKDFTTYINEGLFDRNASEFVIVNHKDGSVTSMNPEIRKKIEMNDMDDITFDEFLDNIDGELFWNIVKKYWNPLKDKHTPYLYYTITFKDGLFVLTVDPLGSFKTYFNTSGKHASTFGDIFLEYVDKLTKQHIYFYHKNVRSYMWRNNKPKMFDEFIDWMMKHKEDMTVNMGGF